MGFSYDFRNGKMDVIYHSEEERPLDQKVLGMINHLSQLLPVRMRQRGNYCDFLYDISGTTNLLAWLEDAFPSQRVEMEQKKEDAFRSLLEAGISAEQLMQKDRYMYVENSTDALKMICIPFAVEERCAVPPAPAPDQPLDLYFMQKKEQQVLPKENWEENPQWTANQEPEPSVLPEENLNENSGLAVHPDSESQEEDGTVLYREETDDDEKTVMLVSRPSGKARLLRLETKEVFPIIKNTSRIGRKMETTDICLKGNPTLGREHCMIHYLGGKYYLEDNNSRNATWLDGKRLEPGKPALLHNKSEIRLSNENFIFENEEEQP